MTGGKQNMMQKITAAADYIRQRSQIKPILGITLGSGLAGLAADIEVENRFDFHEIPNFVPTTISGHPGQLLLGHIGKVPVAVLQGRVHYYEGHSIEDTVLPTRVLGVLGAKLFILTNAAGGLLDSMRPGDLMIIDDHMNFTGQNPLRGPNLEQLGPRFPDMTEIYSRRYNALLDDCLRQHKVRGHRGIYCGLTGPSYETPAEIRAFKLLGAGAVGMSTVAEAIAARHMGRKVVGLSCITNLAAGLGAPAGAAAKPLSHQEVKEVASRVEAAMAAVVLDFVARVAPEL
jgi:purine-nucleoside phosphorylase